MSSQPIEHLHPVLDFAHRLVSRLDSLADAPLMSMRPEDKRAALVTLAQGRAQLDALALRLLADAERSEATVESGAGTAADWVAVETRQVRREARADLRLAENLEKHQVLASAMAAGRVNVAQARRSWPRWSGCRAPASSLSLLSSVRPQKHTWWRWRPSMTRRRCGSWVVGSSR